MAVVVVLVDAGTTVVLVDVVAVDAGTTVVLVVVVTVGVVGPLAVTFCHQLTVPFRGGLARSVFSSVPAISGTPSPFRSMACASCVPKWSTTVRSHPAGSLAEPIRRYM